MSTESSTRESAFLTDSLGTLLWKNAGPALMSMIVIALYQIVDGAMLGRRLGPDALLAELPSPRRLFLSKFSSLMRFLR